MTRVIGGRFGGRRLAVPSSGTRPTSDMAREGVFSTLTSMLGDLTGLRFLDIYAGSGAVGIEAWSRGATVTLVESAAPAVATIRANVAQFDGLANDVYVVQGNVETVAANLPSSAFDVVFVDPPYELASARLGDVVASLLPALAPGAVVVVERSARDQWAWPDGMAAMRERRYGDAVVFYGHATDAVEDS